MLSDSFTGMSNHATFGCLFEGYDSVYNNLTVGPPADDKEVLKKKRNVSFKLLFHSPLQAAAFRKFWGDVSEVRRFQDGSIHECVPWRDNDSSTRRTIPDQILRHLLDRHANIESDKIFTNFDGFMETVLHSKTYVVIVTSHYVVSVDSID